MKVDGVGYVPVGQWHGVGVLAECRGGIAVSEAGLGLEHLATTHQDLATL